MAQIARNNEAKKATDNVAELGKRAADKGVDVAQSLGCTRNRGFDCITERCLGAADELGLSVDMIVLHGESSVGVRGKYESNGAMKKPLTPEQILRTWIGAEQGT